MIKNDFLNQVKILLKGKVFTNSAWGIFSNLFQNILFSIFFIVLARKYNTSDFANYILANTLYGFVVAFSSLGLGQWFIRMLLETDDKQALVYKFFKIQILIGLLFYVINIVLTYSIYDSVVIRHLSLLIGINVIFDNIIYVIKFLNIAELEQKKSFIILTIEAVLKFFVACLLFITYIPIIYLSIILIFLRFITLNIFIRWGTTNKIQLVQILKVKLNIEEVKKIVLANWSFIVIGSISVVYWRIGNILISKLLTLNDVANYEISYKLFSMAEILPFIVSTSIFPLFIKTLKKSKSITYKLYKKAFFAYSAYGLFVFTFIFSFSDSLIPILFGQKYSGTPFYCKEMFLTILIFPTALLQANLLIAMKQEKMDMWFNAVSLLINVIISVIGLYFFKSLIVVNYAIFFSFLIFHLLQDVLLAIRKITKPTHALMFYLITSIVVLVYYLLAQWFNTFFLFFIFWFCIAVLFAIVYFKLYLKNTKSIVSLETIDLKPELSDTNSKY
jgi:O-antigen/teichoic acid export membrane protein